MTNFLTDEELPPLELSDDGGWTEAGRQLFRDYAHAAIAVALEKLSAQPPDTSDYLADDLPTLQKRFAALKRWAVAQRMGGQKMAEAVYAESLERQERLLASEREANAVLTAELDKTSISEAEVHKAIKPYITKREQGLVMGALRGVIPMHDPRRASPTKEAP